MDRYKLDLVSGEGKARVPLLVHGWGCGASSWLVAIMGRCKPDLVSGGCWHGCGQAACGGARPLVCCRRQRRDPRGHRPPPCGPPHHLINLWSQLLASLQPGARTRRSRRPSAPASSSTPRARTRRRGTRRVRRPAVSVLAAVYAALRCPLRCVVHAASRVRAAPCAEWSGGGAGLSACAAAGSVGASCPAAATRVSPPLPLLRPPAAHAFP